MKKFLLSMMVLSSMMTAQGQTDVWTATLQHGNELNVFRTANAFVDAYNAAVDGDIITLSEGTFNGVNINKSITIYGAGFDDDDATGTRTTTINGDLSIASISNTMSLHIEGCYFPGYIYLGSRYGDNGSYISSLRVQKCRFNKDFDIYCPVGDAVFLNNVILNICGGGWSLTSLLVQNCCICGAIRYFPALSPIIVDHCVLLGNGQGAYYYTNDIFTWSDAVLAADSNARNCSFWGGASGSNFAEDCYYLIRSPFTDVDNPADGNYYTGRTWSLAQPDVWVGTDGTPIGPIGGLGWSAVPRIPVIRSLDLNVDGPTLKINYEAEVRE